MKMEGSSFSLSGNSRFLNPWVHNFQKLGLELKCPLCLDLLNRPVLLPCNHMFCRSCVPRSADCSVCKAKFVEKDLRHVPFLENMATIYKCLDATFSANLIQSACPDDERNTSHSPASTNIKFEEKNNVSPQCRAIVEMGVNPAAQSSPDSPPSFGDAKGSDNDSPFQCNERTAENSLLKIGSKEHSRMGKHSNDRSGLGDDDTFRGAKRQKQLTYGPGQSNKSKADQTQVGEVSRTSTPSSDLKLQTLEGPRSDIGDCAFCHSSEISEESGMMLHFLNERFVDGEEAMHSSVIHVHKLCIDWAPQVFYVEDKAKNLKAEVARGAKLKCSKCGVKGAALGCYVKSCRRSYHLPCARKISKCRWDNAQFLMLCAAHSAVKFPNEKSRAAKIVGADHAKLAVVDCPLPSPAVVPKGDKKWILCGSALSIEDKTLMVKFGKMNGSAVSKYWNPNVTHVIAATDESGACTRTLKVLMAILNGRWIVKVDWIKACIEAKSHVDEEPFEVCLDNYGCRDSPKIGRIRAANDEPKLFRGLSFYFVGDFVPSYLEDLQDLVIAAGGTLVKSREEILALESSEPAMVVYNIDSPEGYKLGQEVSVLWRRMSEAEDVALQTGSKVVGHTWLLESIAAYKLQPVC